MSSYQMIDLFFPAHGRAIRVDHGYSLYSALSRVLELPDDPWLHSNLELGIHLIRGRYTGEDRLILEPTSCLGMRLSTDLLPKALKLAGKTIGVQGDKVRFGIPQPRSIIGAPNLYAHLVTTRNGQDTDRFDAEIANQLAALNLTCQVQRGKRRTFQVKGKQLVAYSLNVTGLSEAESIFLQEQGLGGRRKMGCGIFLPKESSDV